ncbi:hypothetical protein [Leptolyngbya sp. FACHB-261]|uniref:hypothetical protein n=1 Tax=Leptolyngbya sp. FACHB-261 TaxID=2692806 RepID=UPI001686F630|nr:hypothetical protein [Leptolyngbya sp. FACHB-261]MBD2101628.1 hypothetical protein [Leptolyngbya sp. FACHB-261]
MSFKLSLQVWLADSYDFAKNLSLELFQCPAATQTVRITVREQVYWLWLYVGSHLSLEQVEDEARAVEQLHQNGVKVAYPICRKDGKSVGNFGDFLAVAFASVDGSEVKIPTTEQAAAFGSLVANIIVLVAL